MQKADPLIRTKLRMPFTRQALVPRPRLQEQVAQGLRGPLTLITAPPGFGKTTLAAACVAGCETPVAWLSLDREDNQAGRFLSYLIAALQGADGRIGGEAAQLMAGIEPAPPEAVLTSLINDLDAAGEEMILVLDDYQLVNSRAVHEQVAFLLEYCPSGFHLLIATRSDPPLPLSRLRARGQTVELRAADLRFTAPETAEFLNDVMGLDLDARSVAALEERTEGWIAGLQMAALSMRDRKDARGFIEGFSGTNRYILDYLMEEVLASQPPEIQRFLLHTSILERLTAQLCDVVLENRDWRVENSTDDSRFSTLDSHSLVNSQSILEYLERSNLFLAALDDERHWYRYHQLFADLLRARLHQAQADLVPVLHVRAAAWLEQNRFIPAAIRHLYAAHEVGRAADLIERYGPALWAASDLSVMQMADSLPREMLIERPKIGIHQAWYFILRGHIDKTLPLLHDLAESLAGADRNPEQQWIYTMVRLALAFLYPPAGPSGAYALPVTQELEQIPADEPVMRDAADILYGMALGRRGEIGRAVEFSEKILQKGKLPHEAQTILTLVPFLATMYLFQGRLQAAYSLAREYLEPIQERGIRVSTAGNLDIVLGFALYQWNRLEEAEKQVREGLKANEPWKNIMTDAFGMLILTQILRANGDYAGAMAVVEKFESRLQEPTRPIEFQEEFHTLRVRVQLDSGDLLSAARWAEKLPLNEDFRLHPERYQLTLARIRLAQGRYADAEEMLDGISRQATWGFQGLRQLEVSLLLAAAIAGQAMQPEHRRRQSEALGILESALVLAEPEGYVRVFLDVGEAVRGLLGAYLNDPACRQRSFAQKVLAMFETPEGQASQGFAQGGLVEALTPRELDVLRLLAQGRSNRQIAESLVLSEGTVKFYVHAVMEKLGVHSRAEAIVMARERNLV